MNIIVTGVSSGIGRDLTKELIKYSHQVWGISRRGELLKELENNIKSPNFLYTAGDVSDKKFWDSFINKLSTKGFKPEVIVFNAAVYENDLIGTIDINKLSYMIDVNFISIMRGVKQFIEKYNKNLHFITISSTSAFKGTSAEGIGYAASKAAVSVAFESLYQKYFNVKNIKFSTVYFGPVKTDMLRFKKYPPMLMTRKKAVKVIIKAIKEQKPFYFTPKIVFFVLKVMSLLPKSMATRLMTLIQKNI